MVSVHETHKELRCKTQNTTTRKKSNNNIKFFSFMKSNQIYNRSRRGTWRSLYAKKKKKKFLRFCSCCFKCFLFMHVTSKALTRLHLNPLSNFYDNSYTPPHTYIHRHAHKCNSHFFFFLNVSFQHVRVVGA